MKGVFDLKYQECNLKGETKHLVVKCIADAIGDDVKVCIQREHLNSRKSNAEKLLKWDFINRNLVEKFSSTELTAEYAKRGPWCLVPLLNKEKGTLFSVMKEERFNELQKRQGKRKKAHYIDALVSSFNVDLDKNKQLSFLEKNQFEENEVKSIVEGILKDFQTNSSRIHRYAIILFEEYNYELISIRCCVLDSSLQIVDEENWNEFIHYNESVVVDNVAKEEKEQEMPKIRLKDKARKRIGQKDTVAIKNDMASENTRVQ